MAQYPQAVTFGKNPAGAQSQGTTDTLGALRVTKGGNTLRMNLTAAAVIKATPGRIAKIIINAPGTTSGAFTLNDCATVGAAAAANQIWTLPFGGANNLAGACFELEALCAVGIVLSTVPGAGSPMVTISYT